MLDCYVFRTIFVMDLLDGFVVHAVRGERENYRHVHLFSGLVNTSNPIEVINSLQPKEVYIADLNRLNGNGDNKEIIEEISRSCNVMLDWGVKSSEDLKGASEIADKIILGTETASIDLIAMVSGYDISVSLDIKNGALVSRGMRHEYSPLELVEKLNDIDISDLIILDMDSIGTKAGIDLEFLEMVREISGHSLILGGGIKEAIELKQLEEIGFSGALVATAIHDGSIPAGILKGE